MILTGSNGWKAVHAFLLACMAGSGLNFIYREDRYEAFPSEHKFTTRQCNPRTQTEEIIFRQKPYCASQVEVQRFASLNRQAYLALALVGLFSALFALAEKRAKRR